MLQFLKSRFTRFTLKEGLSVVSFSRRGIGFLYYGIDDSGTRSIQKAGFFEVDGANRSKALIDIVAEYCVAKSSCRIVLDSSDYRLIQIAAPDVPDDEKREALRWKIQEFIDFPAAEAEIEYFPMPSARQSGSQGAVSALICRNSVIREYTSRCESAGLFVEVIDVPELTLRNLSSRLPECGRGVAILVVDEGRSKLQVQKGDIIYLSRELDYSLEDLQRETVESAEGGGLDRLSLEVQRSLDYYESYFGNPPVAGIVVTPIPGKTQFVADALNHNLGILSRAMDVNALVSGTVKLTENLQQRCLNLVGEALRGEAIP